MTRRSSGPVDANSRIVVTGGAVGLGLALVGTMAWAGRSPSLDDANPVEPMATEDGTEHRVIVILPEAGIDRAELPAVATPARRSNLETPVSRSQGS